MNSRARRRTVRRVEATAVVALVSATLFGCSLQSPDPLGGTSGEGADLESSQRWVPEQGTSWQWQLTGELDPSVDVPVYEVDGFDVTEDQIAQLHAAGRSAICYISVGAWEEWRPDRDRFPDAVLGAGNGWDGERWLDIRRLDVLLPLIEDRFRMCAEKGFDAVEADNVDGYMNATGFELTAEDQLRFNREVARIAHRNGLSIALKNDVDQVVELEPYFDFAVNESCVRWNECHKLQPFLDAGKAVLHVEYDDGPESFCRAVPPGFSSMWKPLDLGPARRPC